MTELIRYEAARRALTEAVMFDEVMNIMNVAQQAALYAKQANDNELVEKATEIRVRAQRRAGEMLKESASRGERISNAGEVNRGKKAFQVGKPSLADLGISGLQSHQWQSLASMTDEHFETAVATAKDTAGQVTTAFMLREAEKARRPHGKPMTGKKAEALREELSAAQARGVSMLSTYIRLTLQAIRVQEDFTEEERELLVELDAAINQKVSVPQ